MKKGQGFARRVTPENLAQFKPLLTAPDAATPGGAEAKASAPTPPDPALAAVRALFKGESARWPVPFKHPPKLIQSASKQTLRKIAPPPPTPRVTATNRGPLLWEKPLAASDVGQQTGNPTGGVRLTQAGFTVNRRVINQTTYFRNVVFGGLSWQLKKTKPKVEEATARFDVTLLGKPYGLRTLAVSHKPSGEAGQGNYTTILHWRALNSTVQGLPPLIKRKFRLYSPPARQSGPYSIEVL
jgi:hypothetical protein